MGAVVQGIDRLNRDMACFRSTFPALTRRIRTRGRRRIVVAEITLLILNTMIGRCWGSCFFLTLGDQSVTARQTVAWHYRMSGHRFGVLDRLVRLPDAW